MEITTMTLEQARAQMAFNEWNQRQDVVILDTETTGLYGAEICEISVIDLEGNVLFDSLVKPKEPIPIEAQAIHGITNKMVENSPSWPEVWDKLYPVIKDKKILIYNAEFDTRMMWESFLPWTEEIGTNRLFEYYEPMIDELDTDCVMKKYADLIGSSRWVKLTVAAGRQIAHRALDDCRATMEVVRKCYDPYFTKETLQKLERWHELEQISKRIRYLSYRMKELAEEQADLLKKQKELQKRLILEIEPETKKETAATVADAPFADDDGIPIDISDDDLPF